MRLNLSSSRHTLSLLALSLGLATSSLSVQAADYTPSKAPSAATVSSSAIPETYSVPVPGVKPFTPNSMMDEITPEARKKFLQGSLATSPLSLRDMMNLLAYKVPAKEGLSYDDVVSSMKQKANKLNFKFVGVNSIYKDIAAISGKPTPRVEVFNFCDAMVARELLDYSLEFVIFLPCRIAVLEDHQGKVWLVTLDWDVSWLDTLPNPNVIPDSLKTSAAKIRRVMTEIMQAGADGEL